MPDYMLLLYGGQAGAATDALVMDAPDIREAILMAERLVRGHVDHGRTYHTHYTYDPGLVIDYLTGELEWKHQRGAAPASLQFARPAGGQQLATPRGQ